MNKGWKWFFKIDFKDWTNYGALTIAGMLFWFSIKTIIGA